MVEGNLRVSYGNEVVLLSFGGEYFMLRAGRNDYIFVFNGHGASCNHLNRGNIQFFANLLTEC